MAARGSSSGTVETVEWLLKELTKIDCEEMRAKRGKKSASPCKELEHMYQIRIKTKSTTEQIKAFLHQLGCYVANHRRPAYHSGRLEGIEIHVRGLVFELVCGTGVNKGEAFEKTLLAELNKGKSVLGSKAKAALANAGMDVDKVERWEARKGRTNRAHVPLEMTGSIIGDIIAASVDGPEYVSVKNSAGHTVGQLGLSGLVRPDFSVNDQHQWFRLFEELGADPSWLTRGLLDYENQTPSRHDIQVDASVALDSSKLLFGIMAQMWGMNYYYLKEARRGEFESFYLGRELLFDDLLAGLTVTCVQFPYYFNEKQKRKNMSIKMTNGRSKFNLQIRNAQSGTARPTQIQLARC